MSWWKDTFGRDKPAELVPIVIEVVEAVEETRAQLIDGQPVYKMAHLQSGFRNAPPTRFDFNDGEKFSGGFGVTKLLIPDYWTLRARSAQLFETNLYARGVIRRLFTNEINTGLHLEATPEEELLGRQPDDLAPWAESTENRFKIWASDPKLCDTEELRTYGQLQVQARLEALVAGDVLVVVTQDPATSLPRIKLVNGAAVQTPVLDVDLNSRLPNGNLVTHGVELDDNGRQVAYWIRKSESFGVGKFTRLPAIAPRSGRRAAWLLYGTDKRLDQVRGQPLLSIVLQSLNEIDKYRDSAQRKAIINSTLAMYITKTQDKPGTLPMSAGAVRVGTDTLLDSTGTQRQFRTEEFLPGLVMEELQVGEEPKGFMPHGTDEKLGDFEETIIQGVAWALQIPPEILRLSFSSNYSASQAAINEFKMYLNPTRKDFGSQFCQPIYVEWLLSQVLQGRIQAPGLLEAWRDPSRYEEFGAWTSADWQGQIKPAVDMLKLSKAARELIEMGLMTRDRAARELTGTKFSKNAAKLRRENEQLAAANEPIAAMERPAPVEDEPEDEDEEVPSGPREVDDDERAA